MINYVVALYLGKRRNELVQNCMNRDSFYLFKSHMLAIHKYKMDDIHKVTFVLNPSENLDAESKMDDVFNEYVSLSSKKDIQFELIRNPDNLHISYGAWNYGVINGLEDERTKHFFLLEDDYIPCEDNFHMPYVDRSAHDICYVCQMWRPASPENAPIQLGRVAITNGLLNADLSRKVFQKYRRCFMLDVTDEYGRVSRSKTLDDVARKYILSGSAQKDFVKLYQECGYRVVDLGPGWQQLFLNSRSVKVYGEGRPSTIYPVNEYVPITPESFV